MKGRSLSSRWRWAACVAPLWMGIAAAGLVACSDDEDEVPATPPAVDAAPMDVFVPAPPSPTPPPPMDGGVPPVVDAAPPVTDAVADTRADARPDAPPAGGAVPSTPAQLFPWLQDRNYSSWTRESSAHASSGPHGDPVRVYVNPTLEQSLQDGDATHPVGSAAVKELYGGSSATDLFGWAAMVKVAPGSGADTWYFYEIFSTTDPSSPVEGRGNPGCAGCHALGRDHFRSAYPLR